MSLPPAFIVKSVEDSENRGTQLQREPHGSCSLLIGHAQSSFQKFCYVLLFSRFCFQSYEQCHFYHFFSSHDAFLNQANGPARSLIAMPGAARLDVLNAPRVRILLIRNAM